MAILGYGDKVLSTSWPTVLQGSGSPVGSVTPDFVGQIFVDTAGGTPYTAVGLTSADWTSGGGGGAGDVVGPSSATADHFASYNGTTGKLIKDSGVGASDFATAAQLHDAVTIADSDSIDFTLTGQALGGTVKFGSTATTACVGNDARLSDARTPAAHTVGSHSDWPADVSMTEVGYLDGVTSSIQTQLSAASSMAVMTFQSPSTAAWSTANAIQYIGLGGMDSTAMRHRIPCPKTGTIVACYVRVEVATTGTDAQAQTARVYVNGSATDIATSSATGQTRVYNNGEMSVAVTAGDYINVGIVNGATPPTGTNIFGSAVVCIS